MTCTVDHLYQCFLVPMQGSLDRIWDAAGEMGGLDESQLLAVIEAKHTLKQLAERLSDKAREVNDG